MIEVLTGTDRSRKYWSDLKVKLEAEGNELSEKIGQLKMEVWERVVRIPAGKSSLLTKKLQSFSFPIPPFSILPRLLLCIEHSLLALFFYANQHTLCVYRCRNVSEPAGPAGYYTPSE